MQNPIGQLVCSNANEKYKRIDIFRDSKISIGLNELEKFEIQFDQIRFNIGIIEHKFNSFILQSLSNCCHYGGKRMKIDEVIILNENDLVRFWDCQEVWDYRLVFAKVSTSKNIDSNVNMQIKKDNDFLDNMLRCGICLDIYQRPVQIGCKHSFCGHCLTQWIGLGSKCPSCRQEIRKVTVIDDLDQLSQFYLGKYPEKAKPIEQQMQYEQNNRYYYEYEVTYSNRNQQQDVEINDISFNELEQQQIDDAVPQVQQLQQLPQCKSCQNEYKNFVCPPYQQHVQCCNYFLPKRQLNTRENAKYKMYCQVCKKYTCEYYYNTTCRALQIQSLERWISLIMLYNNQFMPQALFNKIQEILKGITLDYLFNYVIYYCEIKEQFYLEGQQKRRICHQNELILRNSKIIYIISSLHALIVCKKRSLKQLLNSLSLIEFHQQKEYQIVNMEFIVNYSIKEITMIIIIIITCVEDRSEA